MAGTYGSAAAFTVPCNQLAICRAKPLLSVSSSISISSRTKLTRRKNHLRIKILKTLSKPPPFTVSPVPPQSDSAIPIVSPQISEPTGVGAKVPSPVECCPSSSTEEGESRLSEGSSTASLLNFDVAKFSWGSFVRFGTYLLAVFAFQTICTVWVLEYGNSIKKDKNSEEVLSVRSKSGREVLLNGNEKIVLGNLGSKTNKLVNLEESRIREKIEEIRLMAREARKEEKSKMSDEFEDDLEGRNVISRTRIGIEKEVDARLVKLQKRLKSTKERIPESPVNYVLKSENVEDVIVEKNDLKDEEKDKSLIFKKKLKYRNSPIDKMKKPKGFKGFVSNGKSGSNGKVTTMEVPNFVGNNMGVNDTVKRVDKEIEESVSVMFKDDGTNSPSNKSALQRKNDRKNKPSNGVIQKTSSVEILKSHNSKDRKEIMSPSVSSNNSSVGKKLLARDGGGKQSKKQADVWWLNLPYVLVIFMHQGSNDEELGGLFTLKSPSKTQDMEEFTYTVAFEDHVDANNFCYLLESFFEELGNFTTDVVPLPTKELEKVVKSHASKMIVVKKGQLQLYAGQPFVDVEMALLALVDRNENVISLHP